MLDLGPKATAHAIGIAAFGSMSKPLNIGRAGASGLQSALLASLGYTSHADILGAGKFLEQYDDEPRHNVLIDSLGERWSIRENGYKPYPCGFVAHAAIDAARRAGARNYARYASRCRRNRCSSCIIQTRRTSSKLSSR